MAGQRNDYGKRSHSQTSDTFSSGKRRINPNDDTSATDHHHNPQEQQHGITQNDTVFRYLCPLKKIGSIIGRGGEIAKQLRSETKSSIRITEAVPGHDERIVTIYSTSEETNLLDETGAYISPAQHALFLVHDRVIAEEVCEAPDQEAVQVTVRLLVPADQIGCVIGKGGSVIQSIRSDTGVQIRVLKDELLHPLALSNDELLQIIGEPAAVKKALYQAASLLHENPSRSQHLIFSSSFNAYQPTGMLLPASAGGPVMGLYGNYKVSWPSSSFVDRRDEASAKEFSLRMVCPIGNIGAVIGKGGSIVKQIRQESRASIKVDSSSAEGDDCIIFISAMECFEDQSPTINAALRLQPRCSEKIEQESGDSVITTRLLVQRSDVGCLMGKGGAIISEMRNLTRASIRIIAEENLPKVASEDDEMIQITGNLDAACNALMQVMLRLKANLFGRDAVLTAFPPTVPYVPLQVDIPDGPKYGSRDSQSRGRGYGTWDRPPPDNYGSNGNSTNGEEGDYGAYGGFSSGRSRGTRSSGQNTGSQRKHHGY